MTDEDDEFERIERENAMKGQPYYFQEHPTDPENVIFRKPYRKLDDDDIQDYVRPWVGLTDEELLQAYGWRLASGAPNWLLEEAKQELLGALRKVEASIKEKNG
jgi:hypothetical protein